MQRHYIAVLDSRGDSRVEFDVNDPHALAQAREVWDRIKGLGGEVFRAMPDGNGGERLKEFDPNADMVAVPKIVGG